MSNTPSFDQSSALLTVDEAAALLRSSKSQIYELVQAGIIRAVRLPGMRRWWVHRRSIEMVCELTHDEGSPRLRAIASERTDASPSIGANE